MTQKKNLFLNSFPRSWRADNKKSAHDITTASIFQMKTYMTLKKLDADKDSKRKKHDEEQKKKSKQQ